MKNDKDLISLNQLLVNLRLGELTIDKAKDDMQMQTKAADEGGHLWPDDVYFYESLIKLESEENLSQIGSMNSEYHWKTIRKTNKAIHALAKLHTQCKATPNPNAHHVSMALAIF